jgi:hypothetical protein
MKQFIKPSFLLGILFVFSVSIFVSAYQPAYAANKDTGRDKARRNIKGARDCLAEGNHVISESDDIDSYADLFDGPGTSERIVVGLDMNSNGIMSCATAIRSALIDIGKADSEDEAEKYFIKYITGEELKDGSGQSITNDKAKILENTEKLLAEMEDAYNATEPPHTDLRIKQVVGLVGVCFSADAGDGTSYDESKGDFKVDGLGTFQQREDLDFKSFSWIDKGKSGGAINYDVPKIGGITLQFNYGGVNGTRPGGGNWKQDNSDSSSDFYPLRSDISETSGYTVNSIVDCHFVKKNKDWIFSGNVKIENGKAVFTDDSGNIISSPGVSSEEIFTEGNEPSCEGGTLDWVICPIVDGIAKMSDVIVERFLQPVLRVQLLALPNSGDPQSEALYGAWKSFRNIANIILIFGLIAMIVSTAFSSE